MLVGRIALAAAASAGLMIAAAQPAGAAPSGAQPKVFDAGDLNPFAGFRQPATGC